MRFHAAILAALCATAVAQNARDDWKLKPLDLAQYLGATLAGAPLSDVERAQIYQAIDGRTVHDSFTDAQRAQERETVLSARVGLIKLGPERGEQILVEGPRMFCGATGNCPLWIFAWEKGRLRRVLATGGGVFIVKKTSSHGFPDIAVGWHMSAWDESYADYRWDGAQYRGVDCYLAHWPRDSAPGAGPPQIRACP